MKFENLNEPKFTKMDVARMKRVKGGYTSDTFTAYSSGGGQDDGSACCDGVCDD